MCSSDLSYPSLAAFSQSESEENHSLELFFEEFFPDKNLSELIEKALSESPSWQARLSKVDLAMAKYGLVMSESKPALAASFSWQPGKENSRDTGKKTKELPEWNSRAVFAWEFDLWGRWKQIEDAELQLVESEGHLAKGSMLELIYEVARTWYELRFLQEDVALVKIGRAHV